MALPPKVVDRLSWETPQTPGWSSKLLMLSSTIFFLSVFVYIGIRFGYEPYLQAQVKRLDDQISSFSKQVPLDQQKNIASFYSQLVNTKTVLTNHVVPSPFFDWLERNTQVNVFFGKLSISTPNNQVVLTGAAGSVDDVTQQLQIFKQQPQVKQVSIGGLTFGQGSWQFSITLIIDPKFLQPAFGTSSATSTNVSTSTNKGK